MPLAIPTDEIHSSAEDRHPQMVRGPIQQSAWLEACLATFADSTRVKRFVVNDTAGYASAVLARPEGSWLAPLQLPGVDDLGEPMDLVYDSPAALEKLITVLVRNGHPFRLPRIRSDSPTIEFIRRAVGRLGAVIVRPHRNFPYIDLDNSWRSPVDKLTSRRRSDFRRSLKRAQEIGEVTSDFLTPAPDQLDGLLDQAFEIEARSWKGEAGTALARDARRAEFYRRYCHEACRQGTLRLSFLRIDHRIAAMQIAVEMDNGLWLLKVGYDNEFARCSPGNLLIAETIKYAAEKGLKSYEFLGVSETWTQVWTEQEHETVAVRVYPFGPVGIVVLVKDICGMLKRRYWGNRYELLRAVKLPLGIGPIASAPRASSP